MSSEDAVIPSAVVPLGNPPIVADAKKLIEVKYPKLHGRFNIAFNGLPDDMTIHDAIEAISTDVEGWIAAIPDNFKTSNHALSRPKFGISYILQNEEVRSILGKDYCDLKNAIIERAFEALKKDVVIPSDTKKITKREREDNGGADIGGADIGGADVLSMSDDTRDKVMARNAELEETNKFLAESLIKVVQDNYGSTVSEILQKSFSLIR